MMTISIKSGIITQKIYSIGIAILPMFILFRVEVAGITSDKIFLLLSAAFHIIMLLKQRCIMTNSKGIISVAVFLIVIALNSLYYDSCGIFGIINVTITLLIHLGLAQSKSFSLDLFRNTTIIVSICAVLLIVVQYFLFYLIGINWIPIPKNLYRQEIISEYYATSSIFRTGLDFGLYRPSAFFLEPSHFAEYCVMALILSLTGQNKRLIIPVVLTIGIFASTSGLGILSATLVWVLKLFYVQSSTSKRVKIGLTIILALSIVYFILDTIGAATLVLSRFTFGQGQYGTSGWTSRFTDVERAIGNMTTSQWLFGKGFDSKSDFWLSGWFSLIRQIGVVGLLSFVAVLRSTTKKTDKSGKMIVIMYCFLLIFAEISDATHMVFYILPAIACGWTTDKRMCCEGTMCNI